MRVCVALIARDVGSRSRLPAWLNRRGPRAGGGRRDDARSRRRAALLKQGADVNAAQGDGMTALHWAARRGDVELTQMLVYAGANVKATTRLGGYTPLYARGRSGHAAVIAAL